MRFELDHVFICTTPEAPEAERLVQFGLREGPPNQHPGQGTACRRFPFANAMIELLWVNDAGEAQNECTRRTLLWERWSRRASCASPFGFAVRPVAKQSTELPFPAWEYRPAYLPDPLVMRIAEAEVEEPMWFYLDFMRRADREQQFSGHPIDIREITGVALTSPRPLRSIGAQRMVESGILSTRIGVAPLLEIEFDDNRRNQIADFQPHLPLIVRF